MKHTIVLVDDDDGVRLTLAALLEDEGFEVQQADSCAEARELLSSDDDAIVIFLDEHLGDGLGSDLVPLIRARRPHAKIVTMSGSSRGVQPPAAFDACFAKGGAFPDLVELLRSLMGR